MRLVDVVNFNADGSCLEAAVWLAALAGGENSSLCRWLRAYVAAQRKVTLGWIGATVADVAQLNPEAIDLVNDHPEIFEVLLRPFSHDVALLRTPAGFRRNATLGFATIRREFRSVSPFYLPPEFMLTAGGIHDLTQLGVEGVFINSARFGDELAGRIPTVPYRVRGVFGSELTCIPIRGELTRAWLDAVHMFSAEPWNAATSREAGNHVVAWRDGETYLFLPEGLEREIVWLEGESEDVGRQHLRDFCESTSVLAFDDIPAGSFRSYPPHSFSEWFRESRMLGFLHRVEIVEQRLAALSTEELVFWLQAINSDVLSAVEKISPSIQLRHSTNCRQPSTCKLLRSGRGFEGEEYLVMLERWNEDERVRDYVEASEQPHLVKLRARLAYVRQVVGR